LKKESLGIGLMGLGVVGGGVARALIERSDLLAEQAGCALKLRKVLVRQTGKARPDVGHVPVTTSESEFFATPDIDIFVELMGGETPALDYQKRALQSGKHVVTANKEVSAPAPCRHPLRGERRRWHPVDRTLSA
jgi:homoserine dehydrogenase